MWKFLFFLITYPYEPYSKGEKTKIKLVCSKNSSVLPIMTCHADTGQPFHQSFKTSLAVMVSWGSGVEPSPN